MVAHIHRLGALAKLHICGNTAPILPLISVRLCNKQTQGRLTASAYALEPNPIQPASAEVGPGKDIGRVARQAQAMGAMGEHVQGKRHFMLRQGPGKQQAVFHWYCGVICRMPQENRRRLNGHPIFKAQGCA